MTFRFDILAFAFGLALFAYLFGAYSAEKKLPTYPKSLERLFTDVQTDFSDEARFWQRAEFQQTGVVTNKKGAFDGLTFYVSSDRQGARLIDMTGEAVHEWNKPFREVWSDPPHVDKPVGPKKIRWRYAHLYPNGDVLAVYDAQGAVPHGYGMVKLDQAGEVLWRLPRRIHHQAEVTDDGTIWALSEDYRDLERKPIPGHPQIQPKKGSQIVDDFLLRVGGDGEVHRRISLLDALLESPFADILQMFPLKIDLDIYNEHRWNPVHATDVERANEGLAKTLRPVDVGDLMVSVRSLHTVLAVDPGTGRVVWASRGIWTRQHDIDVLDRGNLLVFDVYGHVGPGSRSRVLEINPRSNRVDWDYVGSKPQPLYSFTGGSQQRLSNKNLLITESASGRLLEVNRGGKIVWQYNNPARRTRKGRPQAAEVHAAKRYRTDELEFVE